MSLRAFAAPDAEVTLPLSMPLRTRIRLSFASCHDYPTPLYRDTDKGFNIQTSVFDWGRVASRAPDFFVWGGDIIYGDFPKHVTWMPKLLTWVLPDIPIASAAFVPASGEKLAHMYSALKADTGFATFIASMSGPSRHFGTWWAHPVPTPFPHVIT